MLFKVEMNVIVDLSTKVGEGRSLYEFFALKVIRIIFNAKNLMSKPTYTYE